MNHNDNFKKIKTKLEKAHFEIIEALKIANKTAKCCGASIEDLLLNIERNIEITENHIETGINEKELINEEK